MSHQFCVLGAIGMDVVIQAPRFPEPGESLLGMGFEASPGGKGANRAVAASRLGGKVEVVGCVGDDSWGAELRGTLASEGVGVGSVSTFEGVPTGVGVITVVPDSQSAQVQVPGASGHLGLEHVEAAADCLSDAEILITHLGLDEAVLLRAVSLAAKSGTKVILHAVPDGGVPAEVLSQVDVLVAREGGARALSGADAEVSASGLARRVHALGPARVVITLGSRGALSFDGERVLRREAFAVETVHGAGSGAAFVGALAVGMAEGERWENSMRFAAAAGALATTKTGTLPSMPSREAVEELLAAQGDRD